MKWGPENGDRKAIIQQAEQAFRTLIDNRQHRLSTMVPEIMNLLKSQGITLHDKADMEKFLKENPQWTSKIQQAIGKRKLSVNNSLSSQEKSNIRTLLKTINKTGTTLLDSGEGTMYLLDHTDREGIENRNPQKEDGFNCRLRFSVDDYSNEEIETIKKEIENGNIRDQKSFDKWAKSNLDRQGSDNSDSINAQERAANADNDRLDLQASKRESRRGQDYQNSPNDFGTGFIRIYNNDGTNGPRYIPIDTDNIVQAIQTSEGEIYGFADSKGDLYFDDVNQYPFLLQRHTRARNSKRF